jgi:CDP-glycerol glycerophosphotransferase
MVDFAATGKPVLLYVPDLTDYTGRVRGLYVDLPAVAPGPLLEDIGQVVSALQDLDGVREASAERAARFRATYCHLDDGHATDRVLTEVLGPVLTPTPAADPAAAPAPAGAARDLP